MDAKKFEQIAVQKCSLHKDEPIVVGVSGGADSLCLAELFFRSGFHIIVAHFNHQLRSTSGEDAKLVEDFAVKRRVQLFLGTDDVRAYCEKYSFTLEEGARNIRYDFLFKIARETHSQAVAVGHTSDDQAETVLMHFLRGAGVSGLKGMQFRTILGQFFDSKPVVRPLLETSREETEKVCADLGIRYASDESNFDTTFTRNKLRLELLPLLDSYQPGIRRRLLKTALLMTELDALVDGFVADSYDELILNDGPDFKVLSLRLFREKEPALQRAIIRRVIRSLRQTLLDVDFDCVDRVMKLVQTPNSQKRVQILDGLEATLTGKSLLLKDELVQVMEPDQLWIHADQPINLPHPEGKLVIGNCEFTVSEIKREGGSYPAIENVNHFTCQMDRKKIHFPLFVRTRRNGDRVQPYGMAGHSMKLSDFWINNKLSRYARENHPLVCDSNGICWIPGFRIMHPYQISEDTETILMLKAARI